MVRIDKPLVVADCNVPFVDTLLGDNVELVKLSPEAIDAEAVRNADALITRTRTKCNASLLQGSRCRLVTTATIGTDHIDLDYCASNGIKAVNAPGCNAPAVAQYVWASVLRLTQGCDPAATTIGIVGVGHVGSIVARWGESLGYRVLLCDPPRRLKENDPRFVSLETIARESDIITFHTPHTKSGEHATHHMASEAFFSLLERKPIIINSARGPITDTPALLNALRTGKVSHAVIDCWEGEPAIDPELLERATIATPHIAGYSLEGKTRASIAAAHAIAEFFGFKCSEAIATPGEAPATVTAEAVLRSYNPFDDTAALKSRPEAFENLRNRYNLRHEVGA